MREARRRGFAEAFRQPVACVHQALAGGGAEARLGDRRQEALDPGPQADLLDRRRATEQALGGAEPARTVGGLVVVRGLERPDALAQPGQEGAPLGEAAKERLTEMDVPLDEAGENQVIGDVHDPGIFGRGEAAAREPLCGPLRAEHRCLG